MSTIVDEERETKKRAAEKFEKERPRLEFGGAWEYAPAPESKDHLRLEKKQGLFIGGKFVAPKSRKYFETINPATEEVLAEIAEAGTADVDAAVTAAGEAYRKRWSKLKPAERGRVHLPDRAPDPGEVARACRARVDERRQADQGIARRGRPARARPFLLPRRLGGQARVRLPASPGLADRRLRADHSLELPAPDGRVEDRAGARLRQHGRPEAGGDDAADRARARRGSARRRTSRRASSTSSRARARRARTSSITRACRRSRSPARPRSAS